MKKSFWLLWVTVSAVTLRGVYLGVSKLLSLQSEGWVDLRSEMSWVGLVTGLQVAIFVGLMVSGYHLSVRESSRTAR